MLIYPGISPNADAQQSSSDSSRRSSEPTHVEFPVKKNRRSLLSRMTGDLPSKGTRPRPDGAALEPGKEQIAGVRDFAPVERKTRKTDLKYPVFKQRAAIELDEGAVESSVVNNVQSKVPASQPLHPVRDDKRFQEFVMKESQDPQTEILVSDEHESTTKDIGKELVSVLENEIANCDQVSDSWGSDSVEPIVHLPAPERVAEKIEYRLRRPSNILLGSRSDSAEEELKPTPRKTEQNVFPTRESTNEESVAISGPVYAKFSDQAEAVNSVEQPALNERLRFRRPDELSSGVDQRVMQNRHFHAPENSDKVELSNIADALNRVHSTIPSSKFGQPSGDRPGLFDVDMEEKNSFGQREESSIMPNESRAFGEEKLLQSRSVSQLQGIQISFGDQGPGKSESNPRQAPQQQAEPEKVLEYEDEAPAAPLLEPLDELGEPEEPKFESEQDLQRDQYRQDLHRSLSETPAQEMLKYLDDDNKEVPSTELQRTYLIDFAGYYDVAELGNAVRANHQGVHFGSHCAVWASPDLCYQPLYFEDTNLERYGARFPFFQPGVSALHFFGSTVRLPYKMGLNSPFECLYSAGYGRPGNPYCYQRERLTWDVKAGSFQALLITAAVFALP